MDKKYLIVNIGSESKKYSLYNNEEELAFIHLEKNDKRHVYKLVSLGETELGNLADKEYEKALDFVINVFSRRKLIGSKEDINFVGIRIVAPGIFFRSNREINKEYIKQIKIALEKAQLHLSLMFDELKKLIKFFTKGTKMFGISDSVFHSQMPDVSRYYAIPLEDASKFEIFRYGYHGISFGSIVRKLKERGNLPEKMIICHLGGGASITALKNGVSVDTSMGFTPLEGVAMATRSGDIDPGALIYLSKKLGLKGDKLKNYLSKKSGLLGLSGGVSSDIRDLLKEEESGNVVAKTALDIYAYRVKKQIGAYIAVLGGVDLLVFSGTVGERSFKMRQRICAGLDVLKIKLDLIKNDITEDKDGVISSSLNSIPIEVIKTDEMKEIFLETDRIARL